MKVMAAPIRAIREYDSLSFPPFQCLLHFPLMHFFLKCLPLIMLLLALAYPNLKLHESSLEINGKRDTGKTFSGNKAGQLSDFLFVKEKFTALCWIYHRNILDVRIRADVHPDHIDFAVEDPNISIL